MNPVDEITTLKGIPLFAGMDDREVAGLRAAMTPHTFAPGQTIIREGEEGDHFYVILRGAVQYITTDASGQEILLDTGGPGAYFGELSMLTGEKRQVRVRAADETATLALNRELFHQFLLKHPHAAIDVLTAISKRLHTTDNMLRQSVSRNVNEVMEDKMTVGQRIADMIAEFSGSIAFLVLNAVWFGGWLLWNQPWFPGYDFDPYPFGLLTMIVSLEAIFLSIFVLVSQNRQSAKDRLSAEIDHQVNVKAEVKTGLIMARLDDIERGMHYLHAEQLKLLKKEGLAGEGNGDVVVVAGGR
jgi:CRP/FNR family cyclic AMP-dependent transcriptional regulator